MAGGGGGCGGGGGGVATPEAATFVVSPTPGVGNFTTIAAALAALPAEGGYLLLREGTFPISASIVLPDKPVVIRGCGRGVTVVDMGANAIVAFSIIFAHQYKFENLSALGSALAGQGAFEIPASAFGPSAVISLDGVETQQTDFDLHDEAMSGSWVCRDCAFFPVNSTASIIASIAGGGSFKLVACTISTPAAAVAGVAGQNPRVSAVDTLFGGTVAVGEGDFKGCSLGDTLLDNNAGGLGVSLTDCQTGKITTKGQLHTLTNCIVTGSGTCAVDMQASLCKMVDCTFNGGTRFVIESAGANSNIYDNNEGFGGTGFNSSTITGSLSVVDGARRDDKIGGTTGDGYASIFTLENQRGLVGIGTMKNTGGVNSLKVKETVTDAFGVTDSVETVVAPGGSRKLDMQADITTARPPYVSYDVSVKSNVPGSSTGFSASAMGQGAL
jgi:hypothetical protein